MTGHLGSRVVLIAGGGGKMTGHLGNLAFG